MFDQHPAPKLEALLESESRFRTTFEQVPVGLAHMAPDGRWLSVNRRMLEFLGYSREEFERLRISDFTHPDDIALSLSALERVLHGTIPAYRLEQRFLRKDGSVVWGDLTVSAVRTDTGTARYLIGCIEDITGRREAQETRSRLEAELQHAQKMESIGRLASNIAHDFNNLLTAILTNAELVLGELPEGELRRDVEVIRQTADRAAALTGHLLAFSRKGVIEPRLLDVNPLVREAEEMLRPLLGQEIALRLVLAPSVGPVLADAAQFEQVLLNLTVNARDAMPRGGSLTLRTRELVVDEALVQAHKGLRAGPYVTVAVEDTGAGMTPEVQARIFEPFFTTKAAGKGTGLGLSIVYGIVKQWGGYVAVASRPGDGTTFTLYLPRQEGKVEAETGEPLGEVPTGTETILVVEAEADIRGPVKRILASHGYNVLEAVEATEAIRLLKQPGGIALVLTDSMIPGFTDRGLIGEMHRLPRPPRILVMSGYDEQATLQVEPLPPGVGVLEKPFTTEGLLRSVRAALDA